MTIQKIPTLSNGTAHYSQTVTFDGTSYIMYFDYNARDRKWYLSLHDSEDTPIEGLIGRKIVVNWNPAVGCTDPKRPPGAFLATSENHVDPGLNDLGESVLLQYIPIADLEALSNG